METLTTWQSQSYLCLQILNLADNDESWNIVGELKSKIIGETGGILQTDNGFSNEQG